MIKRKIFSDCTINNSINDDNTLTEQRALAFINSGVEIVSICDQRSENWRVRIVVYYKEKT